MKKTTKILAALGLALFGTVPAAQAASTYAASRSVYERVVRSALERSQAAARSELELWVDRSQWENAWEVATEHFRVRSNASGQTARWAADSLEQMWPRFEQVLGKRIAAGAPYLIHVYATIAEYNTIGDEHGAHHSSIYGSFFADQHPERPVAVAPSENWTLLGMQLTHSATHALIESNYSGTAPAWLSEGLACYFASFWDYPWCAGELQKMTSHGRFPVYVPLERLLSTGLDQYGDNTHARFIELGMWIHYLLNCREDTRTVMDEDGNVVSSPFVDFVRATLSGQDVSNSAITRLFTQDREQVEQQFMAYDFLQ